MSSTLNLGWWLAPTLLTVATVIYGLLPARRDYHGADITVLIQMLVLVIANLTAWLIWAVLT